MDLTSSQVSVEIDGSLVGGNDSSVVVRYSVYDPFLVKARVGCTDGYLFLLEMSPHHEKTCFLHM